MRALMKGLAILSVAVTVAVGGMFLWSATVSATERIPRPTGLTAESLASGVKLSWTAPVTDETIAGYRIMRKDKTAGEEKITRYLDNTGTTNTTWTDTDVTDGSEYVYQVRTRDGNGKHSAKSKRVRITWDKPMEAPNAPGTLSASSGDTGIDLSWNVPSGGDAPTGYQILRRGDDETDADLAVMVSNTNSTDTTWTDTDVLDGDTFHYRVKGVNEGGVGAQSNSASATWDKPIEAPNAPGTLSASSGDTGIDLSWSAPTDGDAPTGYQILRRGDDKTDADLLMLSYVQQTETAWTDTNAEDGETYHYRVKGVNEGGVGAQSNSASATWDKPIEAPEAPTLLSASSGDTGIDLSWYARHSGDAPTGYQILRRADDETDADLTVVVSNTNSTDTTWTDTDVEDGETFHYRVKGVNEGGVGAQSDSASETWEKPEDDSSSDDSSSNDDDEPTQVLTTGDYVTPKNEDDPLDHEFFIFPLAAIKDGLGYGAGELDFSVTVGPLVKDEDTSTKDYIINFIIVDDDGVLLTDCHTKGLGGSVHLMNVLDVDGDGAYSHEGSVNCTASKRTLRIEVMNKDEHFIKRSNIKLYDESSNGG